MNHSLKLISSWITCYIYFIFCISVKAELHEKILKIICKHLGIVVHLLTQQTYAETQLPIAELTSDPLVKLLADGKPLMLSCLTNTNYWVHKIGNYTVTAGNPLNTKAIECLSSHP